MHISHRTERNVGRGEATAHLSLKYKRVDNGKKSLEPWKIVVTEISDVQRIPL